MPETMKLPACTENEITKDKNGENVPHLEITEVLLIHWKIVNNYYQQNSRVLHRFVPNKSLVQLLEISIYYISFKTLNLESRVFRY